MVENAQTKRPAPRRERPGMKAYGIATGSEGLMDWAWADEQLSKARNYWIASTRADGRPHVAPVWGVWLDGALYFSSARSSVKGRNLAKRPDVMVHLESGDDVVIFDGRAVEVNDRALLRRIASIYWPKYGMAVQEPDPNGVWYAVAPRTALGWLEKDFPNTPTRWVFEDGEQ
ncbi:MAG: pyridoxamine 5'-phosphate oxidase family protein [Anaerolineae bacterium]|nr:pyridoxamine 5'-phosphate oxidase family protein [Anaerolineae bacterium]